MPSSIKSTTAGDMRVLSGQVTLDGLPQDITNWGLFFVAENTSLSLLIEKSIGDGITVLDAINGTFEILLSPSDTSSISGSVNLNLEIEARPPTGGPYTILRDTILQVKPQIIV